jgi:hypothetical protein
MTFLTVGSHCTVGTSDSTGEAAEKGLTVKIEPKQELEWIHRNSPAIQKALVAQLL